MDVPDLHEQPVHLREQAMSAAMPLPPVLYWSAALAEREPDEPLAGLIDLTVASMPRVWDEYRWRVISLDALPEDRHRLVLEVVGEHLGTGGPR